MQKKNLLWKNQERLQIKLCHYVTSEESVLQDAFCCFWFCVTCSLPTRVQSVILSVQTISWDQPTQNQSVSEICQSAFTIWPKAVTMSLMSIVTIWLLLALHICDIPAARHHSLLYFWFLLHMVKCLGIFVRFDTLWKCQMAQSRTALL